MRPNIDIGCGLNQTFMSVSSARLGMLRGQLPEPRLLLPDLWADGCSGRRPAQLNASSCFRFATPVGRRKEDVRGAFATGCPNQKVATNQLQKTAFSQIFSLELEVP